VPRDLGPIPQDLDDFPFCSISFDNCQGKTELLDSLPCTRVRLVGGYLLMPIEHTSGEENNR
jgi:hypothetical protein